MTATTAASFVPYNSDGDDDGDDDEEGVTVEPALKVFLIMVSWSVERIHPRVLHPPTHSVQVCALVIFVMSCVPCVCCWHINRKRPRDRQGNPVVRTHYSAAVMNRDFTVVSA